MKKGVTFLAVVILLVQSCGAKREQVTRKFELTEEEQIILKSGIEPLLYADIETGEPRFLSDYLLVNSIGNFAFNYSSTDSIGELTSRFILENKDVVNESIVFDQIPNVQTIEKKKLDSLGATVGRSNFWSNFHGNWFPAKVGYIEISKPTIQNDRAFFYFFHMENGKSGRLMRVWMVRKNEGWQIDRFEVVFTF